jgi:uracil-DNA glycosylase family 4
MQGFFKGSILEGYSRAPVSTNPHCGACGLYKTCQSPKMPVSGDGKRGILVVGEAPGAEEDKRNTQLIGKTGQHLRKVLRNIGVDLDRDCWKTNALICRPPKNAKPTPKQLGYCQPNIIKAIKELKPKTIILLGSPAVQQVIGWLWKDQTKGVNRWAGYSIPDRQVNAWICPTFHPSYVSRIDKPVLDLIYERHLEAAFAHKDRPWPDGPPDYKAQIKLIHDPNKAAELIYKYTKLTKKAAAFDFETNCLKPESKNSQIVSCSICFDGRVTLAYPWLGDAITATWDFIRSDIPKIASNTKMEQRWTKYKLKKPVKNWAWCTMLGAHLEDCRRGITSIKFQSYIKLGFGVYNDRVEKYLRSKGSSPLNRILEEIDLEDLLLYNGYDSVLEYFVADMQRENLQLPKLKRGRNVWN